MFGIAEMTGGSNLVQVEVKRKKNWWRNSNFVWMTINQLIDQVDSSDTQLFL